MVLRIAWRIPDRRERHIEPGGLARHHVNAMAETQRFHRIMSNEKDSSAGEQFGGKVLKPNACNRIEREKWLVHQHHGSIFNQRPGDGCALAHAAEACVRERVAIPAKTDALEERNCACANGYIPGLTAQTGSDRDIADEIEPRDHRSCCAI